MNQVSRASPHWKKFALDTATLASTLYVAPQRLGTREERADYAANGLPDALLAWLARSQQVRAALNDLLAGGPERRRKA